VSKNKKGQKAEGRGQKGKGTKGAGKKGKSAAAPRTPGEVRLSEHPRARRQINVAKGWAGLAGFALAGYESWSGGLPVIDIALRALLWGTAAYLLVWFCAVQVWRHLAVAEVKSAEKLWQERKAETERLARERDAEAGQAAAMAGGPRA
jgi:hypothetical protein